MLEYSYCSPQELDTLKEKYRCSRPKYEQLAKIIREVLETAVEKAGLEKVTLKHRAKTIESFIDKLERKKYSDPLSKITDFAGVRIVYPYESDTNKIKDIVQSEFKVCETVDKSEEAGSDKMGYLGRHFIVQLKDHTQDLIMMVCVT